MKTLSAPISMDLAITNNCNLKCSYCSHFSSPGDVGIDLPLREWLNFFKELSDLAVFSVTLQGGEPFLREDLKEIIRGIKDNRMRFGILTNGTLITDEMAAFVSSSGRCDSVQVSIDGSTPAIHDSFRGKGNYEKAVRGIEYLRRHNVPVDVRVTIHRRNVQDLDEIAKMLLDDMGLPIFSTNSASYMGMCRMNSEQIQLSIEERNLAMKSLLMLDKKYPGRIRAAAGPLADAKVWLSMVEALQKGEKATQQGGYLAGCNGPGDKLAIRADGIIVPCIHMSHKELGRINRDSLKEIWQKHPELKKIRERQSIHLSEFDFCRNCPYIDYCMGSCPALGYSLLGIEDHPCPESCLKRFLEQGGRLPDPGEF